MNTKSFVSGAMHMAIFTLSLLVAIIIIVAFEYISVMGY